MNPFEIARLKAQDVRRVLVARGVSASAKGGELIAATSKAWRVAIRRVPHAHPLLAGADATIKVKKRWIVIRNDLQPSLEAFLLAHEIGHFFLHQESEPAFEVTAAALEPDMDGNAAMRYVEAYGPRERQELQANVFARELLLPRSLARELFLEHAHSAYRIETDLEIPREVVRLQLLDALLLPSPAPAPVSLVPKNATEAQKPAVSSPYRYTLVEAGPGTGKTTTLLLRLRKLLEEGADPTCIVILTFSNKAARELVERLKLSGIDNAERVWVGTFHSFGLEFLRKFGALCGLKPQVNVMDKLAALSVLEAVLPRFPLRQFDPLFSDPIGWLPEVLDAISRCKDELIDASTYLAEVTAHPDDDAELQSRRLDTAAIYQVYEEELAKRCAVDLNDLLMRTVDLLGRPEASIEEYLHGVRHVLVDEYQDVNRASARLVKTLSKYAETVWAVGDAHQAIYAFMGASNRNLTDFARDFPGAERIPLGSNHRSSQEIADAFHLLSQRSPDGDVATRLKAEKGESSVPPAVITCNDEADELNVLAAKVLAMRPEAPLASQAVLVFSNAMATSVAQGLERRGVPVLFLGNIFERPEIKELLCLLHLSADHAGKSLGSDWPSAELRVPHGDVRALMAQSADDEITEKPWWDRERDCVSVAGRAALERLDGLTKPLRGLVSPWDALCTLLLEDGRILRQLSLDASQSAINARLATWQFAHSCRTPDGIAQYPTVRNLFDRIRRRIRLGQDKTFRHVPPEAEGLDAVRILTAHLSKGLEFEAVHMLEVEPQIYEPKQRRQWPLMPKELLARATGMDEHMVSRLERHNLLYVALSRARKHLTIFKRRDEDLPSALDGIGRPQSQPPERIVLQALERRPAINGATEASLEDLVEVKNRCPRRAEFYRRIGRVRSGARPVYQLLDIAQSRVLKGLTDPNARSEAAISASIEQELRRVELWDNEHRGLMVTKLKSVAQSASRFYNQGGTFDAPPVLRIGSLGIGIGASQVLQRGSETTVRLFRLRGSEYVDSLKQALGALVKTHHQATGERFRAEIAVLADGTVLEATKVQGKTIQAYEAAAADISKGLFPPRPSDFHCPRCPYFMQCDQGRA